MRSIIKVGFMLFVVCCIGLPNYVSAKYEVVKNNEKSNKVTVEKMKEKTAKEREQRKSKLNKAIKENVGDVQEEKSVELGDDPVSFRASEYSLNDAYKVSFITPLMITEYYENNKDFEALLDENVQWFVPIKNEDGMCGYMQFIENDNGFEWIGTTMDGNTNILPESEEKIFEKISLKTDNIVDFKYVYSPFYQMTLIYFNEGQKEYIIPYSGNEEENLIVNGQVYEVGDFFRTLNKEFDEDLTIENGEENGGLPIREAKFSTVKVSIALGIAIMAILLFVIIYKKFKNLRIS